jgi:hypothetical protein
MSRFVVRDVQRTWSTGSSVHGHVVKLGYRYR